MPVEDNNPHPTTVRSADHRASCFNQPRPTGDSGYWTQDGWEIGINNTHPHMVWVPFTMSRGCRQLLPLPECEGCDAEKDMEYIERMVGLK